MQVELGSREEASTPPSQACPDVSKLVEEPSEGVSMDTMLLPRRLHNLKKSRDADPKVLEFERSWPLWTLIIRKK